MGQSINEPMDNNQLEKIFIFLNKNRKYNRIIQLAFYKESVLQYANINKKVYSLLHHIINTQSKLKMDKSVGFFKKISNKNIGTFEKFLKVFRPIKEAKLTFQSLFELLKEQPGWGEKTSALFVKAIYNMHNGYAKELKFWNIIPKF